MASFPVWPFLVAVLFPFFAANGNERPSFDELSTTLENVQKEIVDKHNELRRSVSPSASNMLKMKWNNEAAKNAQMWADKCTYQHSSIASRKTNMSCGENLFMSSHPTSWSRAIQSWYDETHDFIYGVGKKKSNAMVGHYTQIVWDSTFYVGCAAALCPKQPLKVFMVCQYCPAGNIVSRLYFPYKRGISCSSCVDHCDNGLCTNSCGYENVYSNCEDLKKSVTCNYPLVKNFCKASCRCEGKIYDKPITNEQG